MLLLKASAMDFYIQIVEENYKTGWLLGKKHDQEPIRWEYFSLNEAPLPPEKWVLEYCNKAIHQLKPTNDERWILNLLKECVKYKNKTPHCSQIPLKEVLRNQREDYSRVASRFFDPTRSKEESALRQFFDNYDVFKKNILNKPSGKDFLEVKAKELKIRNSKEFTTNNQILPLQHITEVLKIGTDYKNEKSCWFRKTGAIAIDFEENKVYRRKSRVDDLIKIVMDNSFSLLVGEAATGKTVLVRDMAYTLYKEGEQSIYYYQYAGFDIIKLIEIIETLTGILILEDMHLDIPKLQRLYSLLRPNQSRHLLFVLRGGLDTFQDLIRYQDLRKLPQMVLKPFEDADDIVNSFCNHKETPEIIRKKREEIKIEAEDDFWLLAFALEGCADNKGRGEPKDWLKIGVMTYLQSLGNCNDEYESEFPKILLALSPLYMNEVYTHSHYLKKLAKKMGFRDDTLRVLCKRGEILMRKQGKETYYGLPHSSLAKAYWEHGQDYRMDLPDYETFVYEYITSSYPNSLRAISLKDDSIQKKLLTKLSNSKDIFKIIKKENNLDEIVGEVLEKYDKFTCRWMNEELIEILIAKIDAHRNTITALDCLVAISRINPDLGKSFWNKCNKEWIGHSLLEKNSVFDIAWDLEELYNSDKMLFDEMLNLIGVEKIISKLISAQNMDESFMTMSFFESIPSIKQEIMKIDFDQLAKRISEICDIHILSTSLVYLKLCVYQFKLAKFPILDISSIARTLNFKSSVQNEDKIVDCILTVFFINEELGSLLLNKIDSKEIVNKTIVGMHRVIRHHALTQHGELSNEDLYLIDKYRLDKNVILKAIKRIV
jgi:hypothetical protein